MDNLHSRHLNALNSQQQQQQQQQQYLNQYQYTGMHAMHLQSNHHHSQPLTQSQTVIGSGSSSSSRLTTGLIVGDTIGTTSSSSSLNGVTSTTSIRRDTEMERLRLRLMLLEQQMQNQQSSGAAQQLASVSASSLSSLSPSSQYVSNVAGASGIDEYIASLMRNQLNSSLKSSEERLNKLDALLNQREYEIKEMKTKFAIETQRLENDINQLKSAVNRREEELLSEKMRYTSLHKEHEAVKTKLSDTNKYLSELATKEETRQLKNELREAQEEIERQKDELKNSEGKLTKAKITVREKNQEIKDVKEALEREKLAKEKIRIEFDSYKQKTNLTGEIVEKLEQNASLCAELESAKKLLSGLQERNLNQQAKYEKQLGETKELLKQQTDSNVSLKSQLARKEASIKEFESSLKTIEIENDELKNDNSALKEKVKSLEALLGNDSIKALRVLFKEINECASELESLVQTCSDINEGKEIDCCRFLGSANRKSNDHIDLVNNCDTLLSMVNSENLLKRISEIRELRKKLKELKTMISDRVAENIGANSKMLHEMIMCLLGYVGGLFQLKIENNKTKIKLVENLDYLHPGEVEICNKLAEIGNFYRLLCDFYDTYSFGKSINNKPLKEGMYLRSFCDALDTVVLSPYRRVIGQLETDLLKDRFNNIMYLQTHLENYYFIFSSLDNVINDIVSKKLHGCQITSLIYKYTISGNYEIKAVFNQILTLNLHVMYKQLRDWMLYGSLNDKHGEFFIFIMDPSSSSSQSTTSSTLSLATTNNNAASGNYGLVDDENDFADDIFSTGDRFASSFTQYSINVKQLPSFISTKTANCILFNGDLLQLFRSKSAFSSTDPMDEETVGQFSMMSLMNISMNLNQKNGYGKFLNDESEIINKNMDELSKKIWSLSKEEHSIVKFDSLVAEIRDYTSEAVWHLIVEKYNLFEEFQKLKDMYLIGRGELFATFLESSKAMLNKNIDQNFEYNINYMFQKSVSRMLLDNEAWIGKFRVVLNEENLERKSQNGWSRIGLSYRVEWPFHSLITRKVIKKYSEIFNYLISIRRVQIELNQCFLLQMRLGTKNLTQKIDPKIWQTRNHMSFVIDNLQFYLQADVLETQYAELENKIKKSKDFEQIRRAHENFLNKIQSQSFMLNKIVLLNLNSIMELCLSFSSILLAYEDEENLVKNKAALDEITQNFRTQTSLLYKTFKSIEKRQMGTHLEQLLTRINFNNYMEEREGHLGT